MATTTLSRNFLDDSSIATHPRGHHRRRDLAFAIGTLGTATGIAALGRFRPAALVAGAGAALSGLALRWQLQRLFTDEPQYTLEQGMADWLSWLRAEPHR